jgi:hypothetical protein
MGDARPDSNSGPEIELKQISAEHNGVADGWVVAWILTNKGPDQLQILTVRLPHGQFKSEESRFDPAIDLNPGEETQFETLVRCDEPPGDVTENAFVIFHVIWLGEPWRIFTRIRVAVSPDGKPQTTTELITAQKVGFSKVES